MRVTVVGGGIVGLATAFRLQQRIPGVGITILEKEHAVALHQSSHNSGVLHCGLYYKPGSRRALLAVRGIGQMVEFCQTHGIAHEVCARVNEPKAKPIAVCEMRRSSSILAADWLLQMRSR